THAILKTYLASRGVSDSQIMEVYAPSGERLWREAIERMAAFGAGGNTAIVSTISGDSNVHFLREYARQGLAPASLPVMTLSIGESELASLAGVPMDGHLASWSYLGAIDHPANRAFVNR